MREKSPIVFHGYIVLLIFFVLTLCTVLSILNNEYVISLILMIILILLSTGISIVYPNEAVVISFLGRYIGSERRVGLFMTLPFTKRTKVSLKIQTKQFQVRGLASGKKLIINYRIVDSAKALFDVVNGEDFLDTQVELAIAEIVEETKIPLVKGGDDQLGRLRNHLALAGIEVIYINIVAS